jgi:ankyrin repeat protein
MIARFAATTLSILMFCGSVSAAAPSGPWAKFNGKMKADALFRDADGGYLESVRSIVQGGGDLNWQREDGRTPLMSAAAAGHADIVKFMLENGADPTIRDNGGRTAMDAARSAGAMDVVRVLERAAAPSARGAAPAQAAAGNAAAPSGPWAKYNGKFKADALFRDAGGGYLDEVKSIVQGGGDVNWVREDGRTPLMSAAEAGHADVVAYLLQQGADPSVRDANGKSAFDLARAAGAMDVARMLQGGARPAPAPAAPVAQAPARPAPRVPPPQAAPAPRPPAAQVPPANAPAPQAGATRWAPFGTYTPGQRVQFYVPTGWRTGTVRAVGPANNSARAGLVYEKKYEIASDKFPNNPEWTDWGLVAGVDRAPFWTNFFVGDWATGEVMAVNTRIEGSKEISEYSYHAATEGLRINADGSYLWKPLGSPEIKGRWQAAPDGPGVVLLKGYQGANWTLRNETNATDEYLRGIETARLHPDNRQMTITAKRPTAAGRRP